MKDLLPPKTLRLLIKSQWLVESFTSLGSGFINHLTYQNEEIHPDILQEIQKGFPPLVLGEIIYQKEDERLRVAEVEILEVHNFTTFKRFVFRLLNVNPFHRVKLNIPDSFYSCYYSTNPV